MNKTNYTMTWDELLSTGLHWLFKASFFIISSALFAIALWGLPATVFPNDAGWHDLSNMEILFLTGFTLLSARYIVKVRKHSAKVGNAIYRYFTAIGIHTFVFISSELLFGSLSSYNNQLLMNNKQDYWNLAYNASLLLLIFAIAPKGKLKFSQAVSATSPPEKVTLREEKQDHV
ncbi:MULTISPECIES: hypothetical protein [Idiomarina]|uniref:hypothetical protein n=1 Tax=Idiomarina TaxID=135575 RepID=UPI00129CC97F|nr:MULTISPECIES: hypothetical protein [Idiomarina]MRJ43278.1 hypothetical protein [Idiomarina sp. FeN1]NCU58784.1 hypothetical protein [Idiomarina sp. FenA--70]NCU61490.1 hypothetical protein [Idiomarina sp. FenBw--71]UUN13101.1 hypothetical protein KGF88_10730 [Idiomarina loihiensis]